MTLIDTFLEKAANRTEQRFWIGRTYAYMQYVAGDGEERLWGNLSNYRLPRKIRDVKYLNIVAKVWQFETKHNRSPTYKEMRSLIDTENERT